MNIKTPKPFIPDNIQDLAQVKPESLAIKCDDMDKFIYSSVSSAFNPKANIVQDTFNSFYKMKPEFNDNASIGVKNILQGLHSLPEYKNIHMQTRTDELFSALATQKFAKEIVSQYEQLKQKAKDKADQMKKLSKSGKVDMDKILEGMKGDFEDAKVGFKRKLSQIEGELEKTQELMTSWGIDSGTLKTLPLKGQIELANKLLNTPEVKRIADIAGRLKNLAQAKVATSFTHGSDEIVDITQGDNFALMLPTETIKFMKMRTLFYKDFLEKNLTQYNLKGETPLARGPIVLNIDESGSMSGDKEDWAKGIAIALARICELQRRDFGVLSFDNQAHLFGIFKKGIIAPEDKVRLATMRMDGGGTAFIPPLEESIKIIEQNPNLKPADIVFITDGIADVNPQWLTKFKAKKEALGFRVISIVLAPHGGYEATQGEEVVSRFSDNVVVVKNLSDLDTAGDVFGQVVSS